MPEWIFLIASDTTYNRVLKGTYCCGSIRKKSCNRSKEAARASYNRLSRWYDAIAGSTEKKYRDWGLKKLSAQPSEKILEIGFGTGHCLVALANAVGPLGEVIGLDISDGMLAIAQERLRQDGLNNALIYI